MDMSEVLLPQIEMEARYLANDEDNSQINSSSIYSYLNMRGLGRTSSGGAANVKRYFNAIPYLGYWDIYKNYYANKGVVVKDIFASDESIDTDPAGATGHVEVTMEITFKWNNTTSQAYGSPKVEEFEIDARSVSKRIKSTRT